MYRIRRGDATTNAKLHAREATFVGSLPTKMVKCIVLLNYYKNRTK